MTEPAPPTHVRYRIIGVAILMAFILYLDRICMADIVKSASFHQQLGLSKEQIGKILGAFFFSYALLQVPAGWLSDRFGARPMLTIYIVVWSLVTLMTGFMTGFIGLLLARLLCGVGQAGAYPTCMALIRKWIPLGATGTASGMVSFGGRLGGTLAPLLTAPIIIVMVSWRAPLSIYGVAGLVIAVIFWVMVRSSPREHPKVNAAELALIGRPQGEKPLSGRELVGNLRLKDLTARLRRILVLLARDRIQHAARRLLAALRKLHGDLRQGAIWSFITSLSLWCSSASQFLMNIGWGFLVTWLSTYLVEERHLGEVEAANRVSIALALGMLGQVAGGFYCDWATRRFGLRWGRVLPMSSSMFLCAAAYVVCPYLESTWLLVGCCALVSFGTDLANPAGWAFMADVGGRATAAAGGWTNMWGNFGASATAVLIPWLLKMGGGDGKTFVFFTLAGAFVLAGLVVLPMDATKKLVSDESVPPG